MRRVLPVCVAIILVTLGCKKDKPDTSIAGMWDANVTGISGFANGIDRYVFNSNGSYEHFYIAITPYANPLQYDYSKSSGSYKLSGNNLILTQQSLWLPPDGSTYAPLNTLVQQQNPADEIHATVKLSSVRDSLSIFIPCTALQYCPVPPPTIGYKKQPD